MEERAIDMSDDKPTPWYLKALAVLMAAVMWLSGWVSAIWFYIDKHK